LDSLPTGGGGGWGAPTKRENWRVLWDILNEYITPEQAKEVYGVSINKGEKIINEEGIAKLREKR
jgi:N-methylhydantoinase B